MNKKILDAYFMKCKEYNWNPTYKGLKAFNLQIKNGFRNMIDYEFEYQKAN